MNWLPIKTTAILGQGITGSEGTNALTAMLEYGTPLVAGVTPKKGGTTHCGIPIFDTVLEACHAFPQIGAAVQFVPPSRVLGASTEALVAGIPLIVIGAERVPTRDAAEILATARMHHAHIIGPASVGMINPREGIKIGFIGGSNPTRSYTAGTIAVVSKSGGMTSEIGIHLQKHGYGVSWAIGTGGERIIGSDYADIIEALENDPTTEAVVVFGEFGGFAEERLAQAITKGNITKPVVAFIAGECATLIPQETQFGHAGAILSGGNGTTSEKRAHLMAAGVHVVEDFDMIGQTLKNIFS